MLAVSFPGIPADLTPGKVRTGLGIKDIAVSKKGMHWPLQLCKMISMEPRTYSFALHNMSKVPVACG